MLARLDLSLKLTPKQETARLAAAQARLLQLRLVLGGQIGDDPKIGPPVCVVFEGWDASGKGGAIRRLVEPLDPRHVRVAQFGAPSYDEKRHHFLWRFWPVLPGWGGMAVLDRSWYGRVLVERVEGYASEGPPDQNYNWSRQRAEAVREYLQSQFHIDPKYIGAIPLAEHPPRGAGRDSWNGVCLVLLVSK